MTVARETIHPVIIPGDSPGSCAIPEARQDAITRLKTTINIVSVSECGGGL